MINGYFDLPNGSSDDNIFLSILIFQVLFAVSVLAVSIKFKTNPNGLGRLAHFATPAAIVITAMFTVIPQPFGSILFVVAPVFMAPAATRRAYGILQTAKHRSVLFTYMS